MRTRTRQQSAPHRLFASKGEDIAIHPYSIGDADINCGTNVAAYEVILDQYDPFGHNLVNRVRHEKHTASLIADKYLAWKSVWAPDVHPIYVERLFLKPNYVSFPTYVIPWSDLVTDLARQVDERIERTSLLAVTALEFSKTFQMVRNPFGLLKRDWRKRVGSKTAAALSKGSSVWLEGNYGWMSAYYDIKSYVAGAKKLAASINREPKSSGRMYDRYSKGTTLTFSPRSPTMSDANWATKVNSVTYPAYRCVFANREVIANTFVHVGRAPLPMLSHLEKCLQTFGGTWDAVLPTLWEIVPYSFVVDWFVKQRNLGYYSASRRLSHADCSMMGYSIVHVDPFKGQYFAGKPSVISALGYQLTPDKKIVLTGDQGMIQRYHRYAGVPAPESFLTLSGRLSVLQSVSGLGLIIQRALR